MFRLHVTTNVGLAMPQLQHLEEPMTLQHLGRFNSVKWFKICLPKKFVVGDNAYNCSETLLTPFSGVQKEDPAKDAFNFYLSQLRICIEQTFGLMTPKWRILRQPLQTWTKLGKYSCALQDYTISASMKVLKVMLLAQMVRLIKVVKMR